MSEKPDQRQNVSFLNMLPAGLDLDFGQFVYTDGNGCGPFLDQKFEIIYLRTGRVEVQCDDETFEITAPAMALVVSRRALTYAYAPQQPCHVSWCQASGATLSPDAVETLRSFRGVLPPSEAATALFTMGVAASEASGGEQTPFGMAVGTALFQEFIDRKLSATQSDRVPQRVEMVRHYIDKNFEQPITMADLADVSGYSQQHLNRLFHTNYNENPLDYLWRLRTRYGAFLLKHTDLQISQIAYRTGFKTPNHFARYIRNRYGMSPRSLRAHNWQWADKTDGTDAPVKP